MKILALETAADPGSVALWRDGTVTARTCPLDQTNSAALLPEVRALRAEAGLDFSDLDAVAFGAGPGSFTGLRVACGVAQGLAFGRGVPLLGIGTLEAMACESGGARVFVALDARMGEVYHACYVDGVLQGEIGVHPPEQVPLPDGDGWLACGNAFTAYPRLRERFVDQVSEWQPERLPGAVGVVRLAAPRFARGEAVDPALAAPVYVRDKVAKTVAERLAEGGRA